MRGARRARRPHLVQGQWFGTTAITSISTSIPLERERRHGDERHGRFAIAPDARDLLGHDAELHSVVIDDQEVDFGDVLEGGSGGGKHGPGVLNRLRELLTEVGREPSVLGFSALAGGMMIRHPAGNWARCEYPFGSGS
jgi:hypothetical protein